MPVAIAAQQQQQQQPQQGQIEAQQQAAAGQQGDAGGDDLAAQAAAAAVGVPPAAAAAEVPAAQDPAAAAADALIEDNIAGLADQMEQVLGVGVGGDDAAAAAEGDQAAGRTMPRHITCLDPLVELQGLAAVELLSPMIPITEQGVEFLFVKEEEEPPAAAGPSSSSSPSRVKGGSSGGSKGSTVYKPALPALSSLALSGELYCCYCVGAQQLGGVKAVLTA